MCGSAHSAVEIVLPMLADFTRIPCLSPAFEPGWEADGHLAAAARLLALEWGPDPGRWLAEGKVRILRCRAGTGARVSPTYRTFTFPYGCPYGCPYCTWMARREFGHHCGLDREGHLCHLNRENIRGDDGTRTHDPLLAKQVL